MQIQERPQKSKMDNQDASKSKNFMTPQFENAIDKREKFAVNLRKKKT